MDVGSGMSFMRSVHARKLDGISNEEDGLMTTMVSCQCQWIIQQQTKAYDIVEHKVLVAFLSLELQRPTSNIANAICTPTLWANSRNSKQSLRLLADAVQELGRGQMRDVMRSLKLSPCANGRCVDCSFWYAFAIEGRERFDQLRVLQEHETLDRRVAKSLRSCCICIGATWLMSAHCESK